MLTINILTIFPEYLKLISNYSIIKKAITKKALKINIINFRQFSKLSNNQVDDYEYGGGGMVLMCEPIINALNQLKLLETKKIFLSPYGNVLNQKKLFSLAKISNITIICGHYEGFDYRLYDYADEILSIGNYILSGGETAALVLIDCLTRLLPNVINKKSLENESFNHNLLDFPHYTRPQNFNNKKVPDILLSGNHNKINEWRKKQQLLITKKYKKSIK